MGKMAIASRIDSCPFFLKTKGTKSMPHFLRYYTILIYKRTTSITKPQAARARVREPGFSNDQS